jgi:hypothetical protein
MINSKTYTWNQAYIDNGFPSSSSITNSGVVNAGSTSAQTSSRIILTDYDVPINYWGDLNQTLYYIPSTIR